jgi:hypothetical protein
MLNLSKCHHLLVGARDGVSRKSWYDMRGAHGRKSVVFVSTHVKEFSAPFTFSAGTACISATMNYSCREKFTS